MKLKYKEKYAREDNCVISHLADCVIFQRSSAIWWNNYKSEYEEILKINKIKYEWEKQFRKWLI